MIRVRSCNHFLVLTIDSPPVGALSVAFAFSKARGWGWKLRGHRRKACSEGLGRRVVLGWAAKTKQELSAGPTTREAACALGEGADGTGLGWVAVGGSAVGEMAAEGRAGSGAETKQQLSAGPTTREAARTLEKGRMGLGWAG